MYEVSASAGSLRGDGAPFPHHWTEAGVSVEADFTGAHLLHLAVAGCVLNDIYREAAGLRLTIDGVRVRVQGDFNQTSWASTGIEYTVELDSPAGPGEQQALLARVDQVAEIPKALRAGTTVQRRS